MNRYRELVRDLGGRSAATIKNRKVAALSAVVLLIIAIVTVSLLKTRAVDEHSAEEAHEEGHHESSVQLSEEAQKAAGIEVQGAAQQPLAAPIEATAVIELNNDRMAKISPRTSGRLAKLVAAQGDFVRAGQALAWFDSPELGQAWAEYAKSRGRVEVSRKNLQREQTLFEKKISPEKDVIKAKQELSEAEADLAYANEKFHLLGIDIDKFDNRHQGDQHPMIAISSPISGSVIERTATQGEVVSPDKTLFTVADLSALWVVIDIYEKDLGRLRTGTAVKVTTAAYPDKNFKGIISYIGDVMDDKTRTVKARVVVENTGRFLKPGMFAAVTIDAKGVQTEKAILIPEEAVFLDGSRNYVFIRTAPEKFEMREIAVGRTLGNRLEVTSGLNGGEPVAVKGAFILKSELKKGELVDEHGHGK